MALTVFRFWLGQILGIWFQGFEISDDALMVNYAAFGEYLMSSDVRYVMLKELGMPIIYRIISITGITYSAALSLLWILNAIAAAFIVWQLTDSDWLSVCIGVFIMFQPSALDDWCGTRLYRAGLLNPLYLMVLLLAIEILIYIRGGHKKPVSLLLLLLAEGAVFSLTYYIKEDGIWLLATLSFMAVFWMASALKGLSENKKRVQMVALCLLPFLVFAITTIGYKSINYHYFGVFETNIRTSGESMRFVSNIYRIDSDDKSDHVWAPKGAIEKAFNASEELKQRPELKEFLYHNGWNQGDIDQHPYPGDFLTWAMKDAVYETGIAETPAEKEAFLRRVNTELEEAFRQGSLKKNKDRKMIIPSMGAFSNEAYVDSVRTVFRLYGRHVLLDGFKEGGIIITPPELPADPAVYERASAFTNMDMRPVETEKGMHYRQKKLDTANRIVRGIFMVYRLVFPLMLAIATAGVIKAFIVSYKNHGNGHTTHLVYALLAAGLLGVSFVYNYMIALWCFCFDHIHVEAEKMYSVGMVSLLCAYILLGTALLYRVSRAPLSLKPGRQ